GVDELCPQACEHALVRLGKSRVKLLARAKTKHSVAQKLEPLIVGDAFALVREARVRQRLLERGRVGRQRGQSRNADRRSVWFIHRRPSTVSWPDGGASRLPVLPHVVPAWRRFELHGVWRRPDAA